MSETKPKAVPKVVYSLEPMEDNPEVERVMRDDHTEKEAVARYADGIVEMIKGKENYRVAVVRHLNHNNIKFKEVGPLGIDLSEKGLPPKPKQSRIHGDKTPALVEWLARHQREVFLSRFGIRELQIRIRVDDQSYEIRDKTSGQKVTKLRQVPVYEKIDGLDFDINKLKSGEQRLIADCKTHLTEKSRSHDDGGEYDDDADLQEQISRENQRI